ncbi:MAG TPA: response regulator transcription factor [Solirubrobacterales bacterium]|jgi:DNA-binding response OmpR family regulator|nr:response regulator transcription factor [Solirubrobacterales bacterium]
MGLTAAPVAVVTGFMVNSDKSPRTVAIIDDDSGFETVLCRRLEQAGFRHVVLRAAPPAEELAAMRLAALVVNPAILGASSWELIQKFAEALPMTGLVICAGQSSVAQRVRGLRLGADDWIGKPCHPEEVVARIEAVTRRHQRVSMESVSDAGPLTVGELEFRLDRFEVLAAGRPIELTKREYELLLLLARSDGRVLSRQDIYQRVWGYAMARGDRSVDVFVRKLRHKLEAMSPSWRYIHTHFGIGYRFDAETIDGSDAPLEAAVPAAAVEVPDFAGEVGSDAPAGVVAR